MHLLTRRNAVVFPDDCPQPPPGRLARLPGAEPALHLRPGGQHHPHPRRRPADHLLPQQARRAERRLHLRRHLPADRSHRPRAPGADRRTPIPPALAQRCSRVRSSIEPLATPPNDGNAMGTYTERYVYDAVGNFLKMQHRGSDPAHPGWTRSYAYNETSLIEDGTGGTLLKTSNRLSSTTVGNSNPLTERYVLRRPRQHDPHAAPGQIMQWDSERPAADDPATKWLTTRMPTVAAARRATTSTTPPASACAR